MTDSCQCTFESKHCADDTGCSKPRLAHVHRARAGIKRLLGRTDLFGERGKITACSRVEAKHVIRREPKWRGNVRVPGRRKIMVVYLQTQRGIQPGMIRRDNACDVALVGFKFSGGNQS